MFPEHSRHSSSLEAIVGKRRRRACRRRGSLRCRPCDRR